MNPIKIETIERKRIKSKWNRVFYLPLAIIQWVFYTTIFSGLGICLLTTFGLAHAIGSLVVMNFEDAEESFTMAILPIVLPFKWWYDYITIGEIRAYD